MYIWIELVFIASRWVFMSEVIEGTFPSLWEQIQGSALSFSTVWHDIFVVLLGIHELFSSPASKSKS